MNKHKFYSLRSAKGLPNTMNYKIHKLLFGIPRIWPKKRKSQEDIHISNNKDRGIFYHKDFHLYSFLLDNLITMLERTSKNYQGIMTNIFENV